MILEEFNGLRAGDYIVSLTYIDDMRDIGDILKVKAVNDNTYKIRYYNGKENYLDRFGNTNMVGDFRLANYWEEKAAKKAGRVINQREITDYVNIVADNGVKIKIGEKYEFEGHSDVKVIGFNKKNNIVLDVLDLGGIKASEIVLPEYYQKENKGSITNKKYWTHGDLLNYLIRDKTLKLLEDNTKNESGNLSTDLSKLKKGEYYTRIRTNGVKYIFKHFDIVGKNEFKLLNVLRIDNTSQYHKSSRYYYTKHYTKVLRKSTPEEIRLYNNHYGILRVSDMVVNKIYHIENKLGDKLLIRYNYVDGKNLNFNNCYYINKNISCQELGTQYDIQSAKNFTIRQATKEEVEIYNRYFGNNSFIARNNSGTNFSIHLHLSDNKDKKYIGFLRTRNKGINFDIRVGRNKREDRITLKSKYIINN